jgi:hypothetical protein
MRRASNRLLLEPPNQFPATGKDAWPGSTSIVIGFVAFLALNIEDEDADQGDRLPRGDRNDGLLFRRSTPDGHHKVAQVDESCFGVVSMNESQRAALHIDEATVDNHDSIVAWQSGHSGFRKVRWSIHGINRSK